MSNKSFWKKQISLRSSPADVHAGPEPEPAVADEPVAAPEDVTSLPAGDYGWLTANFDPDAVPEEMPTIAAPPVSAPQPPAPEPEPELPAVAAAPVEVPAAAAVAPAAEAKVPFYKKELKLGKAKTPKAAKAPKAPKAPKEPKVAKEPKAKAERTPFYKKELSFGKAKEPKAPKEPKEPKAAKEPKQKAERTPFYKKELKLGKPKLAQGATEPKAAKQAKAPRVKAAKGPAKGGVVGLKIGASQVAAARVSNGATPQLLQVAREPLADGAVVGGELRDVEALSTALKELFNKNKLPKKNVRLGIANNRIGVRTFEIAGIDDPRQLANAIRFRAQETLPIPLEEAVLDWRVLDESVDEAGQTVRRVLLVVAYRELIDRYVMACRKAGLRLSGIDLEAFAMLRALGAPRPEGETPVNGAQVVVNVGHDRSTFAVSDGRVCEFTRVLAWGGNNLSVVIARALDMTPSEAMPIKHSLSLVAQSQPPEGVTHEALATARDVVMRELQSFARELVSSLRFYQNQPGSLGIAEVVLTGGTAHLPGFSDELGRLIGVPVRVGDPLNRVVLPKKFQVPEEIGVGSLTVAIGLGIED